MLQATAEVTTAFRIPNPQTTQPRFPICELLDAIESGRADEWDDADCLDFLRKFALPEGAR